MGDHILHLDPSQRSTDTLEFQTALRAKIVGQEEGVQALVDLYQQGRLPLEKFVSERIKLDQIDEAFETMHRGEVLRSVVVL